MLLSVLRSPGSASVKLLYILILVFCTLLSLSVHEMCHGLAAYALGDRTAKYAGRLTISPFSHLDPIGALCLFCFGFGWAKPVPVNARNFKNMKGGMVITALAGPASNFLLAFIAVFIAIAMSSMGSAIIGVGVSGIIMTALVNLAAMNLGLAVFNLIPIPPLDGSKVLNAVLPSQTYFKIMQYERFGFIALIILINLPFFNRFLNWIVSGVFEFYQHIALAVFGG